MFQKFAWKNRNVSKICLEKSKFFKNLLSKNQIFYKLPEKSKFYGNLHEKIEIFLTWIHDPQISNQIDAAEWY